MTSCFVFEISLSTDQARSRWAPLGRLRAPRNMAPPKQPASGAGMRSIASFFAPKAKAPPKEQRPGIANGAIADGPSESPSPNSDADADGTSRAAKSAKTAECAAPGSATPRGGGGRKTPPAAPATAVSKDEQHARIDPSSPQSSAGAESPGDAPIATANGGGGGGGAQTTSVERSRSCGSPSAGTSPAPSPPTTPSTGSTTSSTRTATTSGSR